jgi:hypothetical protein
MTATGEQMCDCAYADMFPHRAAGCRYHRDDDDRTTR